MRALALILLCPTAALAGLPGEGGSVVSVLADGITDSEARGPVGLGAEVRAAIPLHDADLVPDLELRAGLVHSTVPPRDLAEFMLANPEPLDAAVPDDVRFSRWEARFQAAASWGATARGDAPRVRAGLVGLVDGTAGAAVDLDPIGWSSDYTRSLRLGPTGAVGWAIPLGDEVGDPLVDVRVGGSVLLPATAGGGLIGGSGEDRDSVLIVDEGCDGAACTFGAAGAVGRETRAFAEGTFTIEHLVVGLELGLEHNARSAVTRARARSPLWDTADLPESADPYLRLSVGWMF